MSHVSKNDPRTVYGWAMYDWANSAYTTTFAAIVAANVFYDGFLPAISTDETIARVSSKGFALGYVGGGLYVPTSSRPGTGAGRCGSAWPGSASPGPSTLPASCWASDSSWSSSWPTCSTTTRCRP